MISRLPLALAAALLAGCAWTPGSGFATVAPGAVTAAYDVPASRLDEQGRWKTSNSYRLALASGVGIALAEVALQAPGQAAAGGGSAVDPSTISIDPANPPPGYTFCHGQDCHRADGSVATYDEIRQELARGGGGPAAPPKTVSALKPQVALASWAAPGGATWTLAGCDPHCFLPQTRLSQAVLRVAKLTASGTVVAAAGGEPRPFTLDLALGASAFTAPVDANVTLKGAAQLAFAGTFKVSEKLFDGLPFERLLAAGPGAISLGADKDAAEALGANFAKSAFTATLTARP